MAGKKNLAENPSKNPNLGKHKSRCSVCAHLECAEIEREFISWKSPADIAAEYNLRNRSSIYRHAHALDLFAKRGRNVRAVLERVMERVDHAPVTMSGVVQAVALYARINSRGEFVERDDQTGIHELFEEMTQDEYEAYAKDGAVPSWFPLLKGTKSPQGSGGNENA
jgi:hypothetical protein